MRKPKFALRWMASFLRLFGSGAGLDQYGNDRRKRLWPVRRSDPWGDRHDHQCRHGGGAGSRIRCLRHLEHRALAARRVHIGEGVLYSPNPYREVTILGNPPELPYDLTIVKDTTPAHLVEFPIYVVAPDFDISVLGPRTCQTFDRRQRTTFSEQWSVNPQRQLAPNQVASAGYVGSRGLKLLATRFHNEIIPELGRSCPWILRSDGSPTSSTRAMRTTTPRSSRSRSASATVSQSTATTPGVTESSAAGSTP